MVSAYDLLGINPNATRAELDRAYNAKRAAYDPARVAGMGAELTELAAHRRAELDSAYRYLRPALAAPPRLTPIVERRRERQTIAALLMFVALAVAVMLLKDVAVPKRTVAVVGADAAAKQAQLAPDFRLESTDGRQVGLADYRGQVVLVNLWATWCPPCVREIPRLVRVYERYKDQGFVILGVNTTYQDDRAKVAAFVRDQGIGYPVLYDTDNRVGKEYTSRLMPTSYLIDRDGKIVEIKVGEVEEGQLSERVAELLGGKAMP